MDEREKNERQEPQGEAQGEELAPGSFRYGRKSDGTLGVDLGDGAGMVEVDKTSDANVAFLPEERLPEDVVERLKEAEELKKKWESVEPFIPILGKPEFGDLLDDLVSRGAIENDPRPKPPVSTEEDAALYYKRLESPNFPRVSQALRAWAENLPQRERDILDTNYRAYNEAYERFEKAFGPAPQHGSSTFSPSLMEKIIASKEVSKTQAKVETPGAIREQPDSRETASKRYQQIRAELRENIHPVRRQDLETEMARLIIEHSPTPKDRSGKKSDW